MRVGLWLLPTMADQMAGELVRAKEACQRCQHPGCDRLHNHAGPHMTAAEAVQKYEPGIELAPPAQSVDEGTIERLYEKVNALCYDLGYARSEQAALRKLALQARDGATDLERQMAASLLVMAVLR